MARVVEDWIRRVTHDTTLHRGTAPSRISSASASLPHMQSNMSVRYSTVRTTGVVIGNGYWARIV
jgi:hypothetical protein